jgi:hypothetical protein
MMHEAICFFRQPEAAVSTPLEPVAPGSGSGLWLRALAPGSAPAFAYMTSIIFIRSKTPHLCVWACCMPVVEIPENEVQDDI